MRRWMVALVLVSMGCGDDDVFMRPDAGDAMFGDASMDASPGDGGSDAMPGDGGVDAGPLACGDAECGWCASRGACIALEDECAFEGIVDGEVCWTRFDPCTVSTCWEPSLMVPACGMRGFSEDFSSGRFAIHRYDAFIPDGPPVTLTLERTGGVFEPALFVTDRDGVLLHGGDDVDLRGDVLVSDVRSGRGESVASVTLTVIAGLPVHVYVTDWAAVVDGGFMGMIDPSAAYRISSEQTCASMGSASESVGSPNSGSLENGVRLMSGLGFVVAATGRDAQYGTQETIDLITAAYAHVVARHPDVPVAQVRDLSLEGGGVPASGVWPHASHKSGRDADITYYLLSGCDPARGCPGVAVPLADFDAVATWTLFEYWLLRDAARFLFVDYALQELLWEEAAARGATEAELERWFQYPRPIGTSVGVIRHEANHRNHFHVRFHCPADDTRCIP